MIRWRRSVWMAYIAVLHVAFFLACWKTDILPRCGRRLGLLPPLPPVATAQLHYQHMLQFHDWMDGSVPPGSVMFLGDSLIQSLCVAAVAPDGVNYGIGGDTTGGLLYRMGHYHSLSRCRAAVIQVGVNDLSSFSNTDILRDYTHLLDAVSQPVIVCGLLPVNERDHEALTGYNIRIRALNRDLEQLCQRQSNRIFLDSGPHLADESGQLAASNHVGDGVHLSSTGYGIWISDLRHALEALLSQRVVE